MLEQETKTKKYYRIAKISPQEGDPKGLPFYVKLLLLNNSGAMYCEWQLCYGKESIKFKRGNYYQGLFVGGSLLLANAGCKTLVKIGPLYWGMLTKFSLSSKDN